MEEWAYNRRRTNIHQQMNLKQLFLENHNNSKEIIDILSKAEWMKEFFNSIVKELSAA